MGQRCVLDPTDTYKIECAVCFETNVDEAVVTCTQGHWVCADCAPKCLITGCPHCREKTGFMDLPQLSRVFKLASMTYQSETTLAELKKHCTGLEQQAERHAEWRSEMKDWTRAVQERLNATHNIRNHIQQDLCDAEAEIARLRRQLEAAREERDELRLGHRVKRARR
jgi:septal ring factor EnvC (AmiA/AmiB activator)